MESIRKKTLVVPCGNVNLLGNISIPLHAKVLIIFAHGSGSSRLSSRNRMVAEYLNSQGQATFLFDLLTAEEDMDYSNRFDIDLLAQRLKNVTVWLSSQEPYMLFHYGFFGASTGAAAALKASIDLPRISAVVSRGGRPDLAIDCIEEVKASTLFIAGSFDTQVLKLNLQAFRMLRCEKNLEIIPGASHLFSEKGTMEKVCMLASKWFEVHLQPLKLNYKTDQYVS